VQQITQPIQPKRIEEAPTSVEDEEEIEEMAEEEEEEQESGKKEELTEEMAVQYFQYLLKEVAAIKRYLRLDQYSAG